MRDGTYNTEEVVRLGRDIYEREVRVQVEASHDGEFVIVDVTTGAWEVHDCECRGDGVAVLAIEVGQEPGNVAPSRERRLWERRNNGAKVSRNSTISGSDSVEALGTALGMIGLWSMPTMPHY